MNKVVLGVLILAVLGLGFWAMTKKAESPTMENQSAENMEWVPAVSFSCQDGTRFVAEFATANSVNILVDGNIVKTLPLVSDSGYRYEDDSHVYVFAGEEVNVTTKAGNKTTSCSQPVDPNNAPFNFGDAGEGGGEKQDVVLIVTESIVGKYQSNDDARFDREFKENGIVVDTYDDKVVATGTWKVYSAEKPIAVDFPVETGFMYVQLVMSGTQSETLNFKIGKMTPEILELTYMERGGVLRFSRVQ